MVFSFVNGAGITPTAHLKGRFRLTWLGVGVITLMDELTSVFFAPAEAYTNTEIDREPAIDATDHNLQEKGLHTAHAPNMVMDNDSDGLLNGAISAVSRLANAQRPVKQRTVFCRCSVHGIRDSHVVDIRAYEGRSSPYSI